MFLSCHRPSNYLSILQYSSLYISFWFYSVFILLLSFYNYVSILSSSISLYTPIQLSLYTVEVVYYWMSYKSPFSSNNIQRRLEITRGDPRRYRNYILSSRIFIDILVGRHVGRYIGRCIGRQIDR